MAKLCIANINKKNRFPETTFNKKKHFYFCFRNQSSSRSKQAIFSLQSISSSSVNLCLFDFKLWLAVIIAYIPIFFSVSLYFYLHFFSTHRLIEIGPYKYWYIDTRLCLVYELGPDKNELIHYFVHCCCFAAGS